MDNRPNSPWLDIGVDAMTQREKIIEMTPLQEAVRLYMSVNGVTARGLQRALGIDHTAVSRYVQGKDVSLENFALILSWLMTKPNNPPTNTGDK